MHTPIWGAVLSDTDIENTLQTGGLVVKPLLTPIQPVSVELRLGNSIVVPRGGRLLDPVLGIGPNDEPEYMDIYALEPNGFILGGTLEWVEMPPSLMGIVCGKSSLARVGLQVEAAGLVDPGWKGNLTLEMKNLSWNTIKLRAGMKIAQIYFLPIFSHEVTRLYGHPDLKSHYQRSEGAVPARLRFDESLYPAPDPAAPPQQP